MRINFTLFDYYTRFLHMDDKFSSKLSENSVFHLGSQVIPPYAGEIKHHGRDFTVPSV